MVENRTPKCPSVKDWLHKIQLNHIRKSTVKMIKAHLLGMDIEKWP